MAPESGMTGKFKSLLPTDLLSALQHTPIESPGKNLQVVAMEPSLMERMLGLFTGSETRRR